MFCTHYFEFRLILQKKIISFFTVEELNTQKGLYSSFFPSSKIERKKYIYTIFEFKFAPKLAKFHFLPLKLLANSYKCINTLYVVSGHRLLLPFFSACFQRGLWASLKWCPFTGRTHPAEIDLMPKRRKIAKFWLQFLAEHSKRFLKRTYFL